MEPMWKMNINTTHTFVGNLGRDHYKQYRNRTLPTIDKTLFGFGNTEQNSNHDESRTSTDVSDNRRMFDASDVVNLMGFGNVIGSGPTRYDELLIEDEGASGINLSRCDSKFKTNIDDVTCIEELLLFYKSPASVRKSEEIAVRRKWTSYNETANEHGNVESTFRVIDNDDIDLPKITTLFEIDFSAFNEDFEENVIDYIYPKQKNPKFYLRSWNDAKSLLDHVLKMHNMSDNQLLVDAKMGASLICGMLSTHSSKVLIVRLITFFLNNEATVLFKLKEFALKSPSGVANPIMTGPDASGEENHNNESIHNTEAAVQTSTDEAVVQQSVDEVAVEPSGGNSDDEDTEIYDYKEYATQMVNSLRLDDTDNDELDEELTS